MNNDERPLMCAENLREGMKLGPIFYIVMPEQVEAFARATGNANPLYTSPSDRIAPPTMRLQDYALLIAEHFRGYSVGIHARQRSEFYEPMSVGQAVRTDGHISRTYRKRGKFYFELEYESRDAVSGQLLTRQAMTAVLLHEGARE